MLPSSLSLSFSYSFFFPFFFPAIGYQCLHCSFLLPSIHALQIMFLLGSPFHLTKFRNLKIFSISFSFSFSFSSSQCMKDLRNYKGVMEIFAGLSQAAVKRLKLTWATVPDKHLRLYDEIEQLVFPRYELGCRSSFLFSSPPLYKKRYHTQDE